MRNRWWNALEKNAGEDLEHQGRKNKGESLGIYRGGENGKGPKARVGVKCQAPGVKKTSVHGRQRIQEG